MARYPPDQLNTFVMPAGAPARTCTVRPVQAVVETGARWVRASAVGAGVDVGAGEELEVALGVGDPPGVTGTGVCVNRSVSAMSATTTMTAATVRSWRGQASRASQPTPADAGVGCQGLGHALVQGGRSGPRVVPGMQAPTESSLQFTLVHRAPPGSCASFVARSAAVT